jgi:hypothetical protein
VVRIVTKLARRQIVRGDESTAGRRDYPGENIGEEHFSKSSRESQRLLGHRIEWIGWI